MDNYTTAMAAFQPQLKALKLAFTKEQLGTKKFAFRVYPSAEGVS